MKINIIGGGPAGLYFSILMKKRFPSSDITVTERNGRDDTFGWGVVFSGKTMEGLKEYDEPSYERILSSFVTWDNVDIIHKDEKISVYGNPFSGISRLVMLNILQDRAEELGVNLVFHKEITEFSPQEADLFVVCDGVNSMIRKKYAGHFNPIVSSRSNKYVWYGTNKVFNGLTLTFRKNSHGIFAAHSYKFNLTTSTFVVECDEKTWRNAGLDSMDESASREYIQNVFAKDLDGNPLLSNRSTWLNFLLVKNEHWVYENAVLLGDACHTAHFSIGSGTKLALEDSITLFEELSIEQNIQKALAQFEDRRKPIVEEYQEAAQKSLLLFENLKDIIDLPPMEVAYRMMTRSARVTYEKIKMRDTEFGKRYDAFKNAS